MKMAFLMITLSMSLMLSTNSFASYHDFDESNNSCSNNSCEYCSKCQCADLGAGRNYCMSLSKYCEAFGNIGAR